MQNPIKKWNLVSTDDFQNELAKYFWSKGYYYERRQNEWKYRKLQLKSLKVFQGIDIRLMSQLIASYHYNKKYLGPAVAYGHLNELFEENSYSIIRETDCELAYQLFLLNRIISKALNELKKNKKYIANLAGPINFSLFAYLCKIFNESKVKWSEDAFTVFLENELKNMNGKWIKILKESIDVIIGHFAIKKKEAKKDNENELTHSIYFKNRNMISQIYADSVSTKLIDNAKTMMQ